MAYPLLLNAVRCILLFKFAGVAVASPTHFLHWLKCDVAGIAAANVYSGCSCLLAT